jgi:alkanesulfonate monooxygenase SsuD/methylene tetrahydromethanopterin reductase-like flavin-dependent oxidoreductase (luciferase family)
VKGAIGRPVPLQEGGIPLWIAGGGERKTLRIAAQYAQYTNFDSEPDAFRRKSEILARHCADVGTDFGAITRSASFNVIIAETEREVADKVAWLRAHLEPLVTTEALEAELAEFESEGLIGTVEQITERLAQIRDLGMGYAICYFADAAYDRSSIDLFADKVIPELAR